MRAEFSTALGHEEIEKIRPVIPFRKVARQTNLQAAIA